MYYETCTCTSLKVYENNCAVKKGREHCNEHRKNYCMLNAEFFKIPYETNAIANYQEGREVAGHFAFLHNASSLETNLNTKG